jgi:hypothetical protein
MHRKTVQGLENYFGPIPTAFDIDSPYGVKRYYIQPWWILYINQYQRNNLLQLLNLVLYNKGPFGLVSTGDWVYELSEMLAKPVLDGTRVVTTHRINEDDVTNMSNATIDEKLVLWLAEKISKADGWDMESAIEQARRYLNA